MIQFTRGDMFAIRADARVNTVNCKGVMGAGVALAFKKRYPDMFKDYQKACRDGVVKPGSVHIWKNLTGDWIINFPTKRDWRDPSRYEDILDGLDALHAYLKEQGPITVALPALGCGHGGLDWGRVSSMIKEKLGDLEANILVFEPADSLAAGRSAKTKPSDDLIGELRFLGFQDIKPPLWSARGDSPANSTLVKGCAALLDKKWIALLPSKEPSEREQSVLKTIARQLAAASHPVVVALVYVTRATDQIAEMFLQYGISVVLFLPFGPLSRKPIARIPTDNRAAPFAIMSIAAPDAAWSRPILAQTMTLLRSGASAALISDPTPEWLQDRGFSNWTGKPIFFIRYGELSDEMRLKLDQYGARPIGRRPHTGEPNLGPLLSVSEPGDHFDVRPTEPSPKRCVTSENERSQQIIELDEKLLKGGVVLSEWCSYIVRETDTAFINGAYLASILTAVSGVETFLRSEHSGVRGSRLNDLIDDAILNDQLKADLHTLRRYRNKWVHVEDPCDDSIPQNKPEELKEELERMALFAAKILRSIIYSNQCI